MVWTASSSRCRTQKIVTIPLTERLFLKTTEAASSFFFLISQHTPHSPVLFTMMNLGKDGWGRWRLLIRGVHVACGFSYRGFAVYRSGGTPSPGVGPVGGKESVLSSAYDVSIVVDIRSKLTSFSNPLYFLIDTIHNYFAPTSITIVN